MVMKKIPKKNDNIDKKKINSSINATIHRNEQLVLELTRIKIDDQLVFDHIKKKKVAI